jgi:hypothetical protein
MEFLSVLMQVTQESFGGSATNLILSTTGLVAAIGTAAGTIAVFFKASRARDFAIQAGQVAQMANQKAVEAKDRIKTGINAMYELTPEEQKAVLKELIPKMDQLAEEVSKGTAQVNVINEQIPEFNANKLKVPRERFDTKPIV